jgi:hypothetical protein
MLLWNTREDVKHCINNNRIIDMIWSIWSYMWLNLCKQFRLWCLLDFSINVAQPFHFQIWHFFSRSPFSDNIVQLLYIVCEKEFIDSSTKETILFTSSAFRFILLGFYLSVVSSSLVIPTFSNRSVMTLVLRKWLWRHLRHANIKSVNAKIPLRWHAVSALIVFSSVVRPIGRLENDYLFL